MKFRTFLFIVLSLVLVFAFISFILANQDVLSQPLQLWPDYTIQVQFALGAFFAVGLVIPLLIGLTHELGSMLERWRLRKATRKSEQIEDEYSRGLVAVVEGREEEALTHFRAVLEWNSRHFNTLIKMGEVLRAQEKYSEAIEYHRKAHHIKEDNTQPLYALVEDYEAKGDMERARVVLGKIIGVNKNSVAAWRKLRSLHIKEASWEKAQEAHDRVEKIQRRGGSKATAEHRFGMGIRYEIGVEHLDNGKPREAAAVFRRLLKQDAKFIPAHVKLGEALRGEGHENDAVQAWYQGFQATGSPIFLTVLEEHYLQREQPLAAIEALKRCVARAEKDTVPRFYLGKLYFRLEMLDDALSVLSSLEGRATYAPTLHYLLGRIHERRNNFRDSSREYRKVIKEMELVQLEYRCRHCGASTMEWNDRCGGCSEWNTVEVNFREEIPLEDLGIAPAPIYSSGL